MPGLLRGVARTAVVAGTATAVSNRVSRRQQGRWAAQEAQQSYQQPPQYQQQPAYPAPPAAETTTSTPDEMTSKIEQLKQLGELKAQGVLTDAEFQEQKRRLLA
ncbi:SHOCT domain-containing protein [Streptomyces griseosporeus]|uniref:SHOCT domain-containing protein n=1 Tax=Streptomyces griseosporeus TaxID=1910 RepID=UPI003701DDB6